MEPEIIIEQPDPEIVVVHQATSETVGVVSEGPQGAQGPPGTTDHHELLHLDGDDHVQYQLRSEKGQPDGYAALGSDALVPQDQLGTGDQDGTKFLRDDGTWQALPPPVLDHGGLTGLRDDDHPQYTTDVEAGAIASAAVAAHEAVVDPHPQYQQEAEKGQPDGYASLDGDGLVPIEQLPPVGVSDHGELTGLADDDHTQYQLRAERGQPDGYASLDGGGLVPDDQIPSGIARDAEVAAAVTAHVATTDPHAQYQKESEKAQPSGYASLGSDGLVPQDQLGTGSQDGTKFLRDDGTWSDLAAGAPAVDHGSLAGLSDDDHPQYTTDAEAGAIASAAVSTHAGLADPHPGYATDADLAGHVGATDPHAQYQKESERAQANGYASLGSDGKVPASQLPATTPPPATAPSQDTFLTTGGQVTWQSGYQYLVAAGSGYIDGTLVAWVQQTITLDAADPSLDRIDVIGIDNTGTAFKVTGTAAANPSEPVIGPDTQLKLALVTVAAGSSAPGTVTETVYAEGAGSGSGEWDWTSSGTGWAFTSTTNPRTGTDCMRGTSLSAGARATGQRGSGAVDPNAYAQLVFYLRFASAWNNNRYLQVWLASSGVRVGNALRVQGGAFGLDGANTTNYQAVVIPTLQFAVPAGQTINQVVIEDAGGAISFGIDDLKLISTTGQVQYTTGLDQSQADARYAQRQANLSDLASAASARSNLGLATQTILFTINGNGAVITTGVKGDLTVDFACTIVGWTLLADQSGSIVIDIWKDAYANYPPTIGDSITASAKPTLSAATKNQSGTLTGWTTQINAGDTLRFNVDSVGSVIRATLALKVTR